MSAAAEPRRLHTFVLHLERSTGRFGNVQSILKNIPESKIVPGVDKNMINFLRDSSSQKIFINVGNALFPHNPSVRPHLKLSRGEAATTISHRSMWQHVEKLMGPNDVALLLEDDAVCIDYPKFLETINHLPSFDEWDWVQLFTDRDMVKKKQLTSHFYSIEKNGFNRLSSMLINKRGLQKALPNIQSIDIPVDDLFSFMSVAEFLKVIFPEEKLWTIMEKIDNTPSIAWEDEDYTNVSWNRPLKNNWIGMEIGAYTGIGNQMFQYAALKAYCLPRSIKHLVCPYTVGSYQNNRKYELDKFNHIKQWQELITRDVLLTAEEWKEKDLGYDSSISSLDPNKTYRFNGYFQNIKYFENYLPLLKVIFDFGHDTKYRCQDWFGKNIKQNATVISLHLRLTDFASDTTGNHPYSIPTQDFVDRSIEKISEGKTNIHIIVFSNDISRAKESFKINGDVSWDTKTDQSTILDDMCLMTMCQHYIFGPSTYAWWGAALTDNPNREIIVSRPDFNTAKFKDFEMSRDLLLPGSKIYNLDEKIFTN